MSKNYESEKTIKRQYTISEGELKELLGMEGRIKGFELWRGLSPRMEQEGVSHDTTIWCIVTEETIKNE